MMSKRNEIHKRALEKNKQKESLLKQKSTEELQNKHPKISFITSAGQGLFPYLKKTDAGVDKINSVNLTS